MPPRQRDGRLAENGEMDMAEPLNFDDKIYQTVHSHYTPSIDKTSIPQKGVAAPVKRDDCKTCGVGWNENKIVLLVNGKLSNNYFQLPSCF